MIIRNEAHKFFNINIIIVYLIIFTGGMVSSIVIPILTDLDIYYDSIKLNIFNIFIIINISTIEAIFIAVVTISLIFWGLIIDKTDNRKKWLLVGIILTIMGVSIILINKTNVINYFIGRSIFIGIGLGVLGPVAYSYAGDIITFANRSALSGGISIIGIISSGIGILISAFFSRDNIFFPFFVIIIVLIGFLVIFILHTEPMRGREEPEIKNAIENKEMNDESIQGLERKISKTITYTSLFKLFKRKTNIFMFLQGFFALIPSVILTYYLISFIHDDRYGGLGFPLEYAIIIVMTPASGRIIGYLVFGYIGDILHNKKGTWYEGKGRVIIAAVTMLLQSPLMILTFLVILPTYNNKYPISQVFQSDYIIFGVLFFIATFIGGGSGPNRRSITYDINEPELRGQASSLFSISDSFGASIGLLIGNILIIQGGYNNAFIILSFGYLLAGIFWLFALKSIRKDEKGLREIIKKRLIIHE